jgi:hypothetical protein
MYRRGHGLWRRDRSRPGAAIAHPASACFCLILLVRGGRVGEYERRSCTLNVLTPRNQFVARTIRNARINCCDDAKMKCYLDADAGATLSHILRLPPDSFSTIGALCGLRLMLRRAAQRKGSLIESRAATEGAPATHDSSGRWPRATRRRRDPGASPGCAPRNSGVTKVCSTDSRGPPGLPLIREPRQPQCMRPRTHG